MRAWYAQRLMVGWRLQIAVGWLVAGGLCACGGNTSSRHTGGGGLGQNVAGMAGGGRDSVAGGQTGAGGSGLTDAGKGGSSVSVAGGGSVGGSGSGTGGAEPITVSPGSTHFVLQNSGAQPIFIQVDYRQWLDVLVDGQSVLMGSARTCWCGEEPCAAYEPEIPSVQEIAPGESFSFDWDGYDAEWSDSCYLRSVRQGEYQAQFCWAVGYAPIDSGDYVVDPQCSAVGFELSDAEVILQSGG